VDGRNVGCLKLLVQNISGEAVEKRVTLQSGYWVFEKKNTKSGLPEYKGEVPSSQLWPIKQKVMRNRWSVSVDLSFAVCAAHYSCAHGTDLLLRQIFTEKYD
jgi:hypothetical protein